jgi:amino acid transporter
MSQNESAKMGFWSVVLLGINGIVGSGIFLLPGQIMHLIGNWSLVVYLFVAGLVLSIAWCFAQCASLFDRNGGAYVYAKEAFGDFIGFEVGIMRWAVGIMAWATLSVGFVTALSSVWSEALQEPMRSVLILSLVGGLGILNLAGVKAFQRLNNVITIAKMLPLVLFVLGGVFYIKASHYAPLVWQELEMDSFGAAALIIFYAFGGFETLVVAAGEMKNPQKNLPRAVMLVISVCSLLYFLIQLIAMGLLGETLIQSILPIADAAHFLLGDSGKWAVTLAMLTSIGGINVTNSFTSPRSGVALAEDGMVPRWIAKHGRFGTPVGAILVTVSLTGILALSGSFVQLATISVISRFVQYIFTCSAVYVLYRRKTLVLSPRRRWLAVVVPSIALSGILWLLLQASLYQLEWGLGGLALGVPLYWLKLRADRRRGAKTFSATS